MKKFNGFQIKMFMAIIMVLDHIDHIPNLISGDMASIFHIVTRCVGVWFAYTAVEGFMYTRSKVKYNLRLATWAGIMFLGNKLIAYLYSSKEIIVYNNIFLTLAIGVLMLNVLYNFKNSSTLVKLVRVILSIAIFVGGIMISEGGIPMIPFMLITYYTRKNTSLRNISYLVFFVILLIFSYTPYDTVELTINMMLHNCDWLFITVIPFLYMYNGERGPKNRFTKYFFYVFYPAHLWIIATIAYFVK
ncbi:TraX family protein [Vallitalea guaymasensis]|uniref:TraX family protein n=1 Tax=Vallitalea guaymasensis TaxID=1185412 RepID=UPI001FA8C04A|nr:TraX family protein [Vallitalea guaymasensis]